MSKIDAIDYNPSKEKDGPVRDNRIINKTCCAITRCYTFFNDREYITRAILFIQTWINNRDGNNLEATQMHFVNAYAKILKDFDMNHVNILMFRMALQDIYVDGEGLDTMQ